MDAMTPMHPQAWTPGSVVRRYRRCRAYTLLEMMMTLIIIQIISTFVMYSISSLNNSTRLDLLSKRVIGELRYARALAMSSGQSCRVDFNVTNQTINVYLGGSTTPVTNAMFPGGQCAMSLKTDQGIAGSAITSVSNAAVINANGTMIYRCTYGCLGTRTDAPSFAQPMTVSFSYASGLASLTVPNAGDAY